MPHRSRGGRHRRYDPGAVLNYIEDYRRSNDGRSPSQRQIQTALNISAPSVVHNMLHRLQYQSLLAMTTYGRGQSAELSLTDAGQFELRRWQREQQARGA